MPTRLMNGRTNVAVIISHSVNPKVSKSWSRFGMSWIDAEALPALIELRLFIIQKIFGFKKILKKYYLIIFFCPLYNGLGINSGTNVKIKNFKN